MDLRIIQETRKNEFNKIVTHVMQSWQWGEFRKSLGTPVYRYGIYHNNRLVSAFQITFHKIPLTSSYVGYLPKGPFPDKELSAALSEVGKKHHCAFIKVEPDIQSSVISRQSSEIDKAFILSPKPLFTKHNFILDLAQSEEEILKNMHPKFRYNIKVAQKHGVVVKECTDDKGFADYLKLYFETTKRQNYHGHNEHYHHQVWKTLKEAGMAQLLIAYYQLPTTNYQLPLTAWMLLAFKDTLYYPYGGSSEQYKNVMASNLVAWEAVKLGKKLGLKQLDLWGALGQDANPKDPWQGFHQFKKKMGAEGVEYIGTYDLIFNQPLYYLFTFVDKLMPLKLFLLKLTGKG